jgi:hypothetical protein
MSRRVSPSRDICTKVPDGDEAADVLNRTLWLPVCNAILTKYSLWTPPPGSGCLYYILASQGLQLESCVYVRVCVLCVCVCVCRSRSFVHPGARLARTKHEPRGARVVAKRASFALVLHQIDSQFIPMQFTPS